MANEEGAVKEEGKSGLADGADRAFAISADDLVADRQHQGRGEGLYEHGKSFVHEKRFTPADAGGQCTKITMRFFPAEGKKRG